MREDVESNTAGAPCLFTQGASGELGAPLQHSNDLEATERAGRMLGHSVMAAIESMLPPGQRLEYAGVVESGAPLATWRKAPFDVPRELAARELDVPLPLKPNLPLQAQIERELASCADRALAERLRRKLNVLRIVGPGPTTPRPLWAWRIGNAVMLGQPDEAYSILQTTLRREFADYAVFVMNLVNGSCGYVAPAASYDGGELYQVWQSPFARGSLELLIDRCRDELASMIGQY
jgi:hypothetical protein